MKIIFTFLLALTSTLHASNYFDALGGSVNNGNGEAEKKLQQFYNQSQNPNSLHSAIKKCITNIQCTSSEKEFQIWNQFLFFLSEHRSQHPSLVFDHPYFQQHPEASYYIDSNNESPLAFNPRTLYISNQTTLPISTLVELLCLALHEKANLTSKGFQNYLCYKLEILTSN